MHDYQTTIFASVGATALLLGPAPCTVAQSCDPIETAKLLASDGASNDFFGHALAISENTAFVGAYSDNDLGSNSGSVYIFQHDGMQWVESMKIWASDGALGDDFGKAVAFSQNALIVGSPDHDHMGSSSGSAYLFRRDGKEWIETAELLASDAKEWEHFGRSVAISNGVAVVGAEPDNAAGSAYVFRFDGTNWIEETKLTPPDPVYERTFGTGVAVDDDLVVVGAPGRSYLDYTGTAWVYRYDGSQWNLEAQLFADDMEFGNLFGYSVAASGPNVLVGAFSDDDVMEDAGAAFMFHFDGQGWSQRVRFSDDDAPEGAAFGFAVALQEEIAMVGVRDDEVEGFRDGSAHFYREDGDQWIEEASRPLSNWVLTER